jgi:hypothetical protein
MIYNAAPTIMPQNTTTNAEVTEDSHSEKLPPGSETEGETESGVGLNLKLRLQLRLARLFMISKMDDSRFLPNR